MAVNLLYKARKLIFAINNKYKAHLVISINEFFGGEGRPVKVYVIKDAFYTQGIYEDKELFRSSSLVYVVLYLRDLLYTLQGEDVPEEASNEGWQKMKVKRLTSETIKFMKEKYVDLPKFADNSETEEF